jgi:Ca2+-binding EF-hand superfamily protein
MMIRTDKVMTRDEVVAHVRKLFAMLDANHDNVLTRDEIDAFRNKATAMGGNFEQRFGDRGMDRGAMFDRLDTNHDGTISRAEYMAARPEVREERVMIMRGGPDGPMGGPAALGAPGMKGMHMHGMGMGMGMGGHLFEMADANHDGRVTLQEAEAAALAHFDKADLNHDGKITPDERQQIHQTLRVERRQN